jgi:hypothetical protein
LALIWSEAKVFMRKGDFAGRDRVDGGVTVKLLSNIFGEMGTSGVLWGVHVQRASGRVDVQRE